MRIMYWWTEDGDPEACEKTDGISEESTECYHCMRKIALGDNISVLTTLADSETYVLCAECTEKSIK